ncbi:flavin reductase family protein [Rubellimicrobium roseum]|uniref:Flavin reductase n=1 Tax=Rubellimicrobium roseum TaxID=687525 RepID=A0A5C4NQY1_9RHOB|nr:flavin reductase family protein [Rubellimicrobium roseum]TNC74809.1 flavin reductase [Rubellimicrobium roseum]
MPTNDDTLLDSLSGPLPEAFRQAFRQHPAGVAVVSADPGDGPVALTVSSLISVSAAPPTVAFSLSAASSSADGIRRAPSMIIHMLRLQDLELARLCATSGADRFGPQVNWTRLPTGEPLYTDVGIWFRARPLHELSVAGATLIVAELLDGQVNEVPEESSIVYLNRRWHSLRPTPEGVS